MLNHKLPLQAFLHWESLIPDNIFLLQPIDGVWNSWTWKEAGDESRRIASALKDFDLPPQSKIGILSKNCAHWVMADLAIMMAGYVSVPIYPTLDASTIQQILEHSEAKIIFVGKLDKFESQKTGIPPDVRCIKFSMYNESEEGDWNSLLSRYEGLAEDAEANHVADELATIMYTSGTSGKPKGVMLNYGAVRFTVVRAIRDLKLPQHPRLLSYLPLSHIAERVGIEMVGIYTGATFYFSESVEKFGDNLAEVQPNLFFAVPRIWAKFQEKILEKMPQKKLDLLLSIPLINVLVRKSIKKKLGLSQASHLFTGAAPIALNLLLWFDKLGIEIFQAYAMTENSCCGTFNRHGANRYGTVGQPLSGVELKIGEEDEIFIKHNALMRGYYKEPDLSNDVLYDGFFRTGDQGSIDEDGFLTITGRIKDIFKTDRGKYVAPSPIEVRLQENTDIEHACVVGTGIPQPIALVVISSLGRAKTKDDLIKSLSDSIIEINTTLNSYEKVEKVVIMLEDWTIENGLMTPSLKIKRNEVEKINVPKYSVWYKKQGLVIWE